MALFILEVDTTDKGGGTTAESVTETVDFKVFYKKQKFDVTFPLDNTISSLKDHIQTLTSMSNIILVLFFYFLCLHYTVIEFPCPLVHDILLNNKINNLYMYKLLKAKG